MTNWKKALSLHYSLSDLAKLSGSDISRMTREQLISAVRAAQKSINPRYERIEERGGSFATAVLSKSGGRISMRGISGDVNALRKELARAVQFLNAKTSSVRGIKEYNAEIDRRIARGDTSLAGIYSSLSVSEQREFWSGYESIVNSAAYTSLMGRSLSSNDLQSTLMTWLREGVRPDDFLETFQAARRKAIEEKQVLRRDFLEKHITTWHISSESGTEEL